MKSLRAILVVVSALCAGHVIAASAPVRVPEVTLTVDSRHAAAVDADNPGTDPVRPLATIGRALALATPLLHDGRSVRIAIGAGVYAETCRLVVPADDHSMAETPLLIEGDAAGGTVIDGLATAGFEPNTWRVVAGEPDLYEHAWPESFGLRYPDDAANRVGRLPKGTGLRRELLYLDNARLEARELESFRWDDPDGPATARGRGNQPGRLAYAGVVARGPAALTPGTYGVIDHEEAPATWRRRIFLLLPTGKNWSDVAAIAAGRLLPDNALLSFTNKRHLTLRRLTVRRAATHLLEGAVALAGCHDVRLADCDISDNYGGGASVTGSRFTIERCRFERNGGKGLGRQFDDSRITDSEFNFNCWRAAAADFLGYDTAGIKIGRRTNGASLVRCVAIGNGDTGFWHDVSCAQIRYERCLSYANARAGFFFEFSAAPDSLGEDVMDGCASVQNADGVMLSDVRRPSVLRSLLADNAVGLRVRETPRVPNQRAEFGYTRVTGNTISSATGQPLVWIMAPDEMLPILECAGNHYATPTPATAFAVGKSRLDLAAWQRALALNAVPAARDADAVVDKISAAPSAPAALAPDSPLARQIAALGVPLPWATIRRAETARVRAAEKPGAAPMDHAVRP